jgi:hypothetical protein
MILVDRVIRDDTIVLNNLKLMAFGVSLTVLVAGKIESHED